MFHQESQRGAMHATAEAVIELFLLRYRKRRCFFAVERAAGLPLAARFFKRNAAPDHLYYVGAGNNFVDEGSGDPAGHGGPARGLRSAAEQCFDARADGAHVGTTRGLALNDRHYLTHVLDGRRAGCADGVLNQGVQFGGFQLGW